MDSVRHASLGEYVLVVSNLSIRIQDQVILENVSFKLRRGKTLAVVGPNGAGKSMLFRALLNLIPFNGEIEWSDKVKVGYVPQNLSVKDIPVSVSEFLSFKKSDNLGYYLADVGLNKSVLYKSLGALSGGQLRRVLIAWAIMDKPDVLLFDEPTTGVDLDTEEAIYDMLKRFTRENGITLLLISHDLHIVRDYSDYLLALNRCVTFYGDSKEIMKPSLQEAIYGQPVCVEARPQ